MKKSLCIPILFLFTGWLHAQPYLDIISSQYLTSPDAGILNRDKNKHTLTYTNLNIQVPVKCKPIHGIALLNPMYEQWHTVISNRSDFMQDHQAFTLAISFIDTVAAHPIRIAVSPMIRLQNFSKDGTGSAQWGVAGLAIFHHKNISYKAGIYFNREYFGNFFVPLFGIDWAISKKDKLFGILPGNMTYEHKIEKGIYYGVTFRAITNSYLEPGNQYFRVDDNQLGIYTDIYLFKQLVLNTEIGHSVFRKLRIGEKSAFVNDLTINDNLFIKVSLAYRIRFDK